MRASIIIAAACASAVLATPIDVDKRDEVLVVDTNIVYTTQIVTVTLGQGNVNAAAPSTKRHGHRTRSRTTLSITTETIPATSNEAAVSTSSAAPAPVPVTSEASAPAPAPTSSEAAPAPAPASSDEPAPAPATSAPAEAPAPASTVAAAPSAAPSSGSDSSDDTSGVATTYRQAAIQRHNLHRNNHGAGNVTWNQALADAAMKDAQKCTFAHFQSSTPGLSYGQNLALGSDPGSIGAIITDQWYSEQSAFASQNGYGQAQPDYGSDMSLFEQWGHFTQVVWKASTEIGCATWRCSQVLTGVNSGQYFPAAYAPDITYCFYSTPGNVGGQYASNVGRPASTAAVAANFNLNPSSINSVYSQTTGQQWS